MENGIRHLNLSTLILLLTVAKRENEKKMVNAKLQEKLALKRRKKEENAKEQQQTFEAMKAQQTDMIEKVLQSQADVTDE